MGGVECAAWSGIFWSARVILEFAEVNVSGQPREFLGERDRRQRGIARHPVVDVDKHFQRGLGALHAFAKIKLRQFVLNRLRPLLPS